MKSKFKEYYPLSKTQLKKIWDSSFIVPDTNVLLSLYRYSKPTSDELLKILLHFKDRLWIPHQIGKEFHSNRLEIIDEQYLIYDRVLKALDQGTEVMIKPFENEFSRHPFINSNAITQQIKKTAEEIKKKIEKSKSKHPNWLSNDQILGKITSIFKNKVGDPYSQEEFMKKCEEGEKRYLLQTPPGYKDQPKDTNDSSKSKKFGDLILWLQIIDKAKISKKPIIFITDDQKEDWWRQIHGKNIGPREELKKEIWENAKVEFHIYQTKQFIEHARETQGVLIKEGTIEEIEAERDVRKKLDQSAELLKAAATKSPLEKGLIDDFVPSFSQEDDTTSSIPPSDNKTDSSTDKIEKE